MADKIIQLQFVPFSSMIDSSFWHELSRLKLEKLCLAETVDVAACFNVELNSALPSLASINYQTLLSYDELEKRRSSNRNNDEQYLCGQLKVFNTFEQFSTCDKRELIVDAGLPIWTDICDETRRSEIDSNLERNLSRFLMIVFADLKRYHYHYWCAFPALNYPSKLNQLKFDKKERQSYFDEQFASAILDAFDDKLAPKDRLYFVMVRRTANVEVQTFESFWSKQNIDSLNADSDFEIFFVVRDPSPTMEHAGWPLRNFIAYLCVRTSQLLRRYPGDSNVSHFVRKTMLSPAMRILSFRAQLAKLHRFRSPNGDTKKELINFCEQYSTVFQIKFDSGMSASGDITLESIFNYDEKNVPQIVGWERNSERGNKLAARFVDLSRQLDPRIVSNDAVHLNLKLMKWRLLPTIDLEVVHKSRCLLLGAGTLGCNISRLLMAWGVSKITFVDCGRVSYSNPVRQTLYTMNDCIPRVDGQPRPKAEAAAEALRAIHPGIETNGIVLSIPMPGHTVSPDQIESTKSDVDQLTTLIAEHDIVFLLMDTRESRWLPTLLAASMHKIVINVALGFDTFLVQRHGIRFRPDDAVDQKNEELYRLFTSNHALSRAEPPNDRLLGHQLGCYFCNDVFAPGDTTRDRTLDQQCTVTRPGLSMIASGYGVELLVSLLQHPGKHFAPSLSCASYCDSRVTKNSANDNEANGDNLLELESILGLIPHQIRGFLSRIEHITPCYRAFEHCTACSFTVIDKWRQERFDFLLRVFNDPTVLEDVTGLKKFHEVDDVLEYDDEDSF